LHLIGLEIEQMWSKDIMYSVVYYTSCVKLSPACGIRTS